MGSADDYIYVQTSLVTQARSVPVIRGQKMQETSSGLPLDLSQNVRFPSGVPHNNQSLITNGYCKPSPVCHYRRATVDCPKKIQHCSAEKRRRLSVPAKPFLQGAREPYMNTHNAILHRSMSAELRFENQLKSDHQVGHMAPPLQGVSDVNRDPRRLPNGLSYEERVQKCPQIDVYLVKPKTDLGMSGGRIIVNTPKLSNPQTPLKLNFFTFPFQQNTKDKPLDTGSTALNVDRGVDKGVAGLPTRPQPPLIKVVNNHVYDCHTSTGSATTLNAPLDLSQPQKGMQSCILGESSLPSSKVVAPSKSTNMEKTTKNSVSRNAYLVDEGITPLCAMKPDDGDYVKEDSRSCPSRQSSILSSPSGSPPPIGTATTSAVLLMGDQVGISSPTRHKKVGWIGQRFYPCQTCGIVFENAQQHQGHVTDGCDGGSSLGSETDAIRCSSVESSSPRETVISRPEGRAQSVDSDVNSQGEDGQGSLGEERKKERLDRGLHICNICNATYKARGALGRHIARVHSHFGKRKKVQNQEHMPVCPVCGDWFTTIQRFRSHLKVHREWDLSPYTFTCTVCGGRYTREEQLERHIKRVHCQKSATQRQRQPYSKFVLHPQDGKPPPCEIFK